MTGERKAESLKRKAGRSGLIANRLSRIARRDFAASCLASGSRLSTSSFQHSAFIIRHFSSPREFFRISDFLTDFLLHAAGTSVSVFSCRVVDGKWYLTGGKLPALAS
jgi:hypothetical protein